MHVTEAIVNFLRGQRKSHPGPDLLDRFLEYGTDLETQVNVAADDGEPVSGKRATWTDGINEWWSIRIPRNAYDEPEWKDYNLSWPLEVHAEAVGSTGWDWKHRCSRWVGFDFDAITGHARGVGIDAEALLEVQRAAANLPYTEVRQSTSGRGIHIYVHLDAIPTANHTEHAALARCVLGMMSAETGFDFAKSVDCCGAILWVWHRKQAGFQLLQAADTSLTVDSLPSNWKDHIQVVQGRRTKVQVDGINGENEDPFDALASARRIIPLDETHKQIIDELTRSSFSTVWIQDHHLLQTHTCALKRVHEQLGLKGIFNTTSNGNDPATPNCFLFPLSNGAWKVFRFGQGVSEDAIWTQDGEGWTTCYYNHNPDFCVAARTAGVELPDNKGYQFREARAAIDVIKSLGRDLTLEPELLDRKTILRPNKDGRLVVKVAKEGDEEVDGWSASRGWLEKVFEVKTESLRDETGIPEYDNRLRTLTTPAKQSAGWFVKTSTDWTERPKSDCIHWLQQFGHSKPEADIIIGSCIDQDWQLVSLPFQPEYPGGRQWNYNAPQFKYKPAELAGEQPHHPHWDLILEHCFCDLDEDIKQLDWAKENNIRNGAQYGLAWTACCFRAPFEPLPMLFFFSDKQNTGKSSFHESLKLLTTGGVMAANKAVTNSSGFNGELANAVIAFIEEEDVASSPYARNRIKDWITAKELLVRRMRTDAYMQPNTLHLIMCANDQANCPVEPGDTRITVIEVFDLVKEIPRTTLQQALMDEAPHFMYTLMNVELPKVQSRLSLPYVNTYKKQRSEDFQRNALELFITQECYLVEGESILFADFYEAFSRWLEPAERHQWSKIKVGRSLPSDLPCGSLGDTNHRHVGNISFQPKKSTSGPYVCSNKRLRIRE